MGRTKVPQYVHGIACLRQPTSDRDTTGEHLLARWHHICDKDSDWALQTYYDSFQRFTILSGEKTRTFDIDFQHHFPLTDLQ
jgi:hypothetical protein